MKERNKPNYQNEQQIDQRFIRELTEEGLSYAEAMYVAACETEGRKERPDVDSSDTIDKVVEKEIERDIRNLNDFLQKQGLPEGDEGVDEWIRRAERSKNK